MAEETKAGPAPAPVAGGPKPFPKMLYHKNLKIGTGKHTIDGVTLSTTSVHSDKEHEEHAAKGWKNSPADLIEPERDDDAPVKLDDTPAAAKAKK